MYWHEVQSSQCLRALSHVKAAAQELVCSRGKEPDSNVLERSAVYPLHGKK